MLTKSMPERAQELLKLAQADVNTRWEIYQYMANMPLGPKPEGENKA